MAANPFLRFLYFLWAYKKVEQSKEQLLIETDLSYTENFVRGGIFLLFFGSSLLALFFSGYDIRLLYYGVLVLGLIILFFILLPLIIFPEIYLSNWLGYAVNTSVDTSVPGRYRTRKILIKKAKGLFQTETHVSGVDNEKRESSFYVNPTGFVENQKLPQTGFGYTLTKHFFRLNNFLIPTRPFFTLLVNIGTLIFSFFPVVNILVILIQAQIVIHLFAVQWKGSGVLNRLLILCSAVCLLAAVLIATMTYFVLFIRF